MHSIHLSDEAFVRAQQLAAATGASSVEDFVENLLKEESDLHSGNVDHLFTDEVLMAVDRGVADADAGRVYTVSEVRAHFVEKSRKAKKRAG